LIGVLLCLVKRTQSELSIDYTAPLLFIWLMCYWFTAKWPLFS